MRRHAVVVDRTGRTVLGRDGRHVLGDEWDLTLIVGHDLVGDSLDVQVIEVGELTADTVANALAQAQGERGPVDRLATISEYLLLPVAQLRESYGIVGHGSAYTARLRDKWEMKKRALNTGVRHIDGLLAQQVAAGARLPYSANGYVLKPRSESGSRGVEVFASWQEVTAAVNTLDTPDKWMVERCATGEMLHVDGYVVAGRVESLVSRYVRPCHVTGGRVPLSSLMVEEPDLGAEAGTFTQKVLEAWNITDDVFHCELFVEEDGMTLCELAGRPGGAGVPEVFGAVRGIDLRHAKIRLDLGITPDLDRAAPVAQYGGWTVVYPPTSESRYVDDAHLHGHRTRRIVAPGEFHLDGLAGVGVATYSFAEDSAKRVRALIDRYERGVRVLPTLVDPA